MPVLHLLAILIFPYTNLVNSYDHDLFITFQKLLILLFRTDCFFSAGMGNSKNG